MPLLCIALVCMTITLSSLSPNDISLCAIRPSPSLHFTKPPAARSFAARSLAHLPALFTTDVLHNRLNARLPTSKRLLLLLAGLTQSNSHGHDCLLVPADHAVSVYAPAYPNCVSKPIRAGKLCLGTDCVWSLLGTSVYGFGFCCRASHRNYFPPNITTALALMYLNHAIFCEPCRLWRHKAEYHYQRRDGVRDVRRGIHWWLDGTYRNNGR